MMHRQRDKGRCEAVLEMEAEEKAAVGNNGSLHGVLQYNNYKITSLARRRWRQQMMWLHRRSRNQLSLLPRTTIRSNVKRLLREKRA